jgi:hypothetical protein
MAADVNGDGRDDIVGRVASTGQWWVAVNQGNGVYSNVNFGAWAPVTWADVQKGDVNGDGKVDIFGRVASSGQWWVAVSNGTSFNNVLLTTWSAGSTWTDVHVADMNGDGKSDVVGRASSGQWLVTLSNGTTGTNSVWGAWATFISWLDVQVADVNNDGKADIVGRNSGSGDWYVALSTGVSLGTTSAWTRWLATTQWANVRLVDMNHDGKNDLVGRLGNSWWVAVNTGVSFTNQLWGDWTAGGNASALTAPGSFVDVTFGDFNGDGYTDILTRKNGTWWLLRNTGTSLANAVSWNIWYEGAGWRDVQTSHNAI